MNDLLLMKASKIKVFDACNRPNNALSVGKADTGQTWQAINGTWGISNNQIYLVSHGTELYDALYTDEGLANVQLRWQRSVVTNNNVRPAFRIQDVNNMLFLSVGSTEYVLFKRVAGVNTTIIATAINIADNDIIEIYANGNNITLLINGFNAGTAIVNDFTTVTKHGLIANTTGASRIKLMEVANI